LPATQPFCLPAGCSNRQPTNTDDGDDVSEDEVTEAVRRMAAQMGRARAEAAVDAVLDQLESRLMEGWFDDAQPDDFRR
jgi:hypothetical protein